MKFKVQATVLSKKLDNLHKIARNKTTLHILDYFKVDVSDDSVMLTASDLDVTLITKVVPEEVSEVGSTCVLADKFAEIVKKVGDVMLTISIQGNNSVIKSKSGTFKIPCVSAEDFPMVREPEDETPITIKSSVVVAGIDKTSFAAYKGEMEPAISGILADFKSEKTAFVATDKNVIGVVYSDAVSSFDRSVIFTPKLASTLALVLSQSETDVDILFDDKNVRIETADSVVYGKLIEANYPNYAPVISQSVNAIFSVNTDEFLKSIDRVMAFCPEITKLVQVSVLVGSVAISGEDVDFSLSAEESVDCENKEGSGIFLINARYLCNILQRIKTEKVEISFSDKHNIVYFNPIDTNDNYMFAVTKLARL